MIVGGDLLDLLAIEKEELGDPRRHQRTDEVLPHLLVLHRDALAVAHHHQLFFQVLCLWFGHGAGRPTALDHDLGQIVGLQHQLDGNMGIAPRQLLAVDGLVDQVRLGAVEADGDGLHE